jgi:hypothetical protein
MPRALAFMPPLRNLIAAHDSTTRKSNFLLDRARKRLMTTSYLPFHTTGLE